MSAWYIMPNISEGGRDEDEEEEEILYYFRSKRVNILTVCYINQKNNIPFKVYLLLIFANRFDINDFIWSNRGQDGY
jgi:hypothetical protein